MTSLFSLPGLAVAGFIGLIFLFKWVNVLNEYERAVTFWLGRLAHAAQGARAWSSSSGRSRRMVEGVAAARWCSTCRRRTSSPATTSR